MDIANNVIETLWRILYRRSNKDKINKVCSDIKESNHVMKTMIHYSNGGQLDNIPWLFIEQENNVVKYAIQKIKFLTHFSLNLNNILTKKREFSGVKTEDLNMFMVFL